MVTAPQLNRAAVEEIEFDRPILQVVLVKLILLIMLLVFLQVERCVNVEDNQIQFMKTRSSAGVGQKVDLEFDQNSLRIRELVGGDAEQPNYC